MLDREAIVDGLRRLDELARAEGLLIDLAVYGGAALALVFDLRQATRDVDAVMRGNPAFLRAAVRQVALEKGWPPEWLNDGVKGFLSAHEEMTLLREFPGTAGGLRIHVPTAEYLFAMKCMAMRPEGLDGARDIEDIRALARIIGLRSAAQALRIVEQFYPAGRIPAKVAFGVEEIMERLTEEPAP